MKNNRDTYPVQLVEGRDVLQASNHLPGLTKVQVFMPHVFIGVHKALLCTGEAGA